jgi:organic radical activating enzyme
MIKRCHSLKILYPYLDDTSADDFVSFPAENKFIQPIDNKNIEGALNEVERLGKEWKLGVQVHKLLNLR